MPVRTKQEFITAVAKILGVHPLKINLEKTTVPLDKIRLVVALFNYSFFIFTLRAKLNANRLHPKLEPTIRELYRATKTENRLLDH